MNDKKNNPWKEWELLAYEYVKNIIKDSEIHAEKHTADSHDLGFDGIWLIRSDDRALMKLVLMEAKYRTSQSSLPLNDCAKAIIIAFNLSASQLYIVTNIPFAPQTKENVIKFQKSINLEITCVNGNDLKNYLSKQSAPEKALQNQRRVSDKSNSEYCCGPKSCFIQSNTPISSRLYMRTGASNSNNSNFRRIDTAKVDIYYFWQSRFWKKCIL